MVGLVNKQRITAMSKSLFVKILANSFQLFRLDKATRAGVAWPLQRLLCVPILVVATGLIGYALIACSSCQESPRPPGAASIIRWSPVPPIEVVAVPPLPKPRPAGLSSAWSIAEFRPRNDELDAIRAGETGVPAIFRDRLPADWRSTPRGPVRKRLFIRTLLPLILQANRNILADRSRLVGVIDRPNAMRDVDRAWLGQLTDRYKVAGGDVDELLNRVDAVPPSLALAQAAIESGWGTSRFAVEGNALFGQWTWDRGDGIAPAGRDEGASHAVKAFPRLADSVGAYMLNLNRASAYRKFRDRRAELRRRGGPLSGLELAETLTLYSTERENYVRKVAAIIRQNRLQAFDPCPSLSPHENPQTEPSGVQAASRSWR